jgi:hypothetical protein
MKTTSGAYFRISFNPSEGSLVVFTHSKSPYSPKKACSCKFETASESIMVYVYSKGYRVYYEIRHRYLNDDLECPYKNGGHIDKMSVYRGFEGKIFHNLGAKWI